MPRLSKRGSILIDILLRQLEEECGYVPMLVITQYGPKVKFTGPKETRDKAFPLISIFGAYCGPSARRRKFRRKDD